MWQWREKDQGHCMSDASFTNKNCGVGHHRKGHWLEKYWRIIILNKYKKMRHEERR